MAEVERIDVRELPVVSSTGNNELNRTWMQQTIKAEPYSPDALNRVDWYDPLDPRILRVLDRVKVLAMHAYVGEPITTISHAFYRTVSAWWIIVAFNGYLHPDEIPQGTMLRIPDLQDVLKRIQTASFSPGEVISF